MANGLFDLFGNWKGMSLERIEQRKYGDSGYHLYLTTIFITDIDCR